MTTDSAGNPSYGHLSTFCTYNQEHTSTSTLHAAASVTHPCSQKTQKIELCPFT